MISLSTSPSSSWEVRLLLSRFETINFRALHQSAPAILAGEISLSLSKLKVDVNAKFRGISSFGKALRAAWGKKGP